MDVLRRLQRTLSIKFIFNSIDIKLISFKSFTAGYRLTAAQSRQFEE